MDASPVKLPPLILHPFAEPKGPAKLMQGSRAGLLLSGLLSGKAFTIEQLERQLLGGRYCEIAMLFYIGKDLLRWAEQCAEVAERQERFRGQRIGEDSFISLLVEDTPPKVDRKLRDWGIYEYKRIFARAVGMHTVFEELPPPDSLSHDFIRHYHRIADQLFACGQQLRTFSRIDRADFDFDLYASGEYSRLLERQWEES